MRKFIYLFILFALLITGSIFLRKYHQSIPFIDSIIPISAKEKKNNVVSEYLAGSVAQRSGDNKTAVEHYEKALAGDPENEEVIKRLYGLYLFNGQYEEAIGHAKRQLEIDTSKKTPVPEREPIAYLMVALDNFVNKKTKDNAALLEPIVDPKIQDRSHLDGVVIPMVLAWSYVVNEDYTNAFRVVDSITAEYMLSVFSYNRALMNDLANNKKVDVDGKNLTLHEKGQKFLSDVFFEIGQYSLQNSNVQEAVVYLRLARYLDPNSFKLKKLLAMAYETMDKTEEAIAIYEEIPETSDNYGEVLASIALAYHRLGDNEKAMEALDKLKAMPGNETNALFAIGSIKMSENQPHDAIKYFEEAKAGLTKLTPDNWNLFFNLGVAYDKTGDFDKSEENLKKAVELYPQNPESLNYLAYSWLIRNKNIAQARAMLEAAVIRSGGAPHILDSYGWALFKLGYYQEAIPFLQQAANSMPYSTVINDHLGDTYWKVGRKREAKFQWQKAIDGYDKDDDLSPEVSKESLQKKLDSGLE